MSTLQLGLIAAGVLGVLAVALFNGLQIRKARRAAQAKHAAAVARGSAARVEERVEPTLASRAPAPSATVTHAGAALEDEPFELPMEVIRSAAVDAPPSAPARRDEGGGPPDPDIECVITLQPVEPVGAGAIAPGLHARLGKPLRWLGRRGDAAPWQRLEADTPGGFTELRACLLLADRSGAASKPMLDAFVRLASEIAPTLPAAFVAPDAAQEAERAEMLDRICADLDVQIGLTVLKPAPETIPGTKLRGIAEAAGFHLRDGGRFDYVQDETGSVLYSLANYRSEPFTVENLRITSTPGAVFLLDVPRVADPVRAFDQMKLAAKRMAVTLDAALVDDNRRPLDDAALASIRQQVAAAADALRAVNIEPGSARALALFGG